mgnify:CR=1 FL=1
MRKKLVTLASSVIAAFLLSGCLVAPVMPPTGVIFTSYKAPLDWDQEGQTLGTKTGSSQSMSILGLVAIGDASIAEAAKDGGLTAIHGADYEYFHVLGVYQRYRTILHGE